MAKLRKRTVFANHGLTVTAVESLEVCPGSTDYGRFVTGKLESIAVIVEEPDKTFALDIDARPIDIDSIMSGSI